MPRRLAVTFIIDGTDDESWPENDEQVHRSFDVETLGVSRHLDSHKYQTKQIALA